MTKNLAPLHSSNSDEWSTPQDFFDVCNKLFGPFTLDGAATKENRKCREFCTDFLNYKGPEKIEDKHRIWLNPPYSLNAEFIKKAYELSQERHQVVCLIPARTDTKYWHEYVAKASHVFFIKGRLKFGNSKNSAPFPSALVVFQYSFRHLCEENNLVFKPMIDDAPRRQMLFWDWKDGESGGFIR